MKPADVSVTEVRSVTEIGTDTWNGLARGDGFYLGYPWTAWAETDPSFHTTYLVARDDSGAVLAAVATYLWDGATVPSMNLAYSPSHIAEENVGRTLSAGEHKAFLPALLVGSRAGYHGGVVVDARVDGRRRQELLVAVFAEVEALAGRLGAASIAMLYVPTDNAIAYREAWNRAVGPSAGPLLAPLSAQAVFQVPSGAPVTATASRANRREWRREQNRYTAAVDRVETVPLSACIDAIAPLLGATQRKYGAPDTDADMRDYLASQVPVLDPYSHVLLEHSGETVVGFSMSYLWPDGVYVRTAGFDGRAAPYSYFNLTMYRQLDLAAARGLPTVNLGAGTYRAKRARGAEPLWTAGLVRPPAGTSSELLHAFTISGSDHEQAVQAWGDPARTVS